MILMRTYSASWCISFVTLDVKLIKLILYNYLIVLNFSCESKSVYFFHILILIKQFAKNKISLIDVY